VLLVFQNDNYFIQSFFALLYSLTNRAFFIYYISKFIIGVERFTTTDFVKKINYLICFIEFHIFLLFLLLTEFKGSIICFVAKYTCSLLVFSFRNKFIDKKMLERKKVKLRTVDFGMMLVFTHHTRSYSIVKQILFIVILDLTIILVHLMVRTF